MIFFFFSNNGDRNKILAGRRAAPLDGGSKRGLAFLADFWGRNLAEAEPFPRLPHPPTPRSLPLED